MTFGSNGGEYHSTMLRALKGLSAGMFAFKARMFGSFFEKKSQKRDPHCGLPFEAIEN